MRYLITGGAGFIGSHLTDVLLASGDTVTVLDDLSTGRHDNIRHNLGNPSFELILGSVLDASLVDEQCRKSDAIFHLAAAVGVKLIVERPLESLLTNIRGSEILFDRAHAHGRKVLLTSTSEIYGKSTAVPLKEEGDRLLGSPLVGRWSYSTSKAVDEILAHTYWKSKGLPTVIVRLFNTVGERQSGEYGMVIPRLVQQAVAGEDVVVFGDGTQTRSFCHVGDIVPGLILLMQSSEAEGLAVNLGSKEEVTILELAQRIVRATGGRSKIVTVPYEQVYESHFEETPRRVPDLARAEKLIGFTPTKTLDEIIDIMVAQARR